MTLAALQGEITRRDPPRAVICHAAENPFCVPMQGAPDNIKMAWQPGLRAKTQLGENRAISRGWIRGWCEMDAVVVVHLGQGRDAKVGPIPGSISEPSVQRF